MKTTLDKYLADWDPMGLVEAGAPTDEYSVEATHIQLEYKSDMTDEELAGLVKRILVDRMGVNPSGLAKEALRRASEIRERIT